LSVSILNRISALADPTRSRILLLLDGRELMVGELCAVLQLPQSTVSRHLKVLSDQNWTQSRRHGTANLYRTILDELDATARKLWVLAREQTNGWPTVQHDEQRLLRHLREKQKDSQAFFAGAAGQWDKLRSELYGSRFTSAAMLSLLPSAYVVADLGCGTGPLTAELAGYVKSVIAVDNSPAMLKAAQKRVEDLESVELRRGDLEALPIEDESVDAALMVLVLTYVADAQAALREMARIIKPGGKAVLVDLLPHDRDDFRRQMEQRYLGFELDAVQKMLGEAGLVDVNCRSLPPEPNVKGPALFLAVGSKA